MRSATISACIGALVALSACTAPSSGPDVASPTSGPVTVVAGPVAATALAVGDCLNGVAVGAAERAEITSAQKVACFEPHAVEVFDAFTLRGADFDEELPELYPGQVRVVRAADEGCRERAIATRMTGIAEFGVITIWPSRQSWQQGDRTVLCIGFDLTGEPLVGAHFG